MKLKFKVNLKKCDIAVSSVVLSETTYKVHAYTDTVLDLAIVEKDCYKKFEYRVYAICSKDNNEYWAELYSFEKRRRIKELSKAFKKYEDDTELERKIRKVLKESGAQHAN